MMASAYSFVSRVLEGGRRVSCIWRRTKALQVVLTVDVVTSKKGKPATMVEIKVFDETFEASITLWNGMCSSASSWTPSSTVLLLTRPGFRSDYSARVTINNDTFVEVDPEMDDAHWLRNFAEKMIKREHVNQPFPEGLFDVQEIEQAPNRILFTLAEVNEFARAAPSGTVCILPGKA